MGERKFIPSTTKNSAPTEGIGSKTENVKKPSLWCSCRLNLALLGCLGFINMYTTRMNLSVSMVCMVNQTAISKVRRSQVLDKEEADLAINIVANLNNTGALNVSALTERYDPTFKKCPGVSYHFLICLISII